MDTKTPARWTRWHQGRVVLHLTNGAVLFSEGRVRLKETTLEAVDYELVDTTFVMIPSFSDLTAIEVR